MPSMTAAKGIHLGNVVENWVCRRRQWLGRLSSPSAAEPFESFAEFPAGVEMTLRKDTETPTKSAKNGLTTAHIHQR